MQKTMQENWKRNTGVFMASQAISLFGSSLVQFAITWYITLTTQSGIYMTISIFCSLLPTLFMSPFAGVWADRYDRKKLIVLADGAIALSTLVLALIFMSGFKPIWLLFAVSVVRSLGGAVQNPAVNAMLPDMVPAEHLTRVNGINGSLQSLLNLAAPALAGALLTMIGSIEIIFFIDVVTAVIAIVIMLRFLHLPKRARKDVQQTGYFKEIREGLSYIRSQSYLMHLLFYTIVICVCIAPVSFLTPLQVVRTYGEDVWRMTAIEIAFSAGMLGGGLLVSTWGGFKNRVKTMGIAVFVMGVGTVLLGVGLPFWIYLGMMVLIGIMMPMFNTPAVVMLQENVDSAYMGRVFSVITMVNTSMMPLGMLFFGPLADRIPIEWLLLATGAVILITASIVFFDRTIMKIGLPKHIRTQGATEAS